MLCKVVAQSQTVKSMVWREAPKKSPSSPGSSSVDAAPGEIAELKKKLADLQTTTQNELGQVRQSAFEQGFRQGRDESSAEVKAASERLAKTLADLANFKRTLRAEAEMDLLKLALAIARRILYRELLTDPEAMHGLVHAALQKVQNREIWRVRVHSAGVDVLRSCLHKIGMGSVEIMADPALKPGDLLIETSVGELDASVDTQLQEIERGFADRLSLR